MSVIHIPRGCMDISPPDYSLIGSRIREARKDAGLTQTELGDYLGLSQAMINKLETGQVSLTLDNLFKLAGILNRPEIYFLGIGTGQLTASEAELIEVYRSLKSQRSKRLLLRALKVILEEDQD